MFIDIQTENKFILEFYPGAAHSAAPAEPRRDPGLNFLLQF